MSRFKNFKIWRARLPHWRADDVTYYVTFRHSRPLEPEERRNLLLALLKPEGRQWNLEILCVLPEKTELMFRVKDGKDGKPYELADVVEKAKNKVGRQIVKKTQERFPLFYSESYDRIVRDEAELEERWLSIFNSPVDEELAESSDEYEFLFVPDAP